MTIPRNCVLVEPITRTRGTITATGPLDRGLPTTNPGQIEYSADSVEDVGGGIYCIHVDKVVQWL